MTEREKLIKDLKRIMPCSCLDAYKLRKMTDPWCSWCEYGGHILDFVLADRKRIVEPLIRVMGDLSQRYLKEGIEKTLKNAGGL